VYSGVLIMSATSFTMNTAVLPERHELRTGLTDQVPHLARELTIDWGESPPLTLCRSAQR
jgi:hypothetical protein